MIGGIQADLQGRTSVEGLLCAGEAASTNVHGANRLASNSLLEGLVFGKLVGRTAADRCRKLARATPTADASNRNPPSTRTPLDLPDIAHSLGSVMWRNVGIIRAEDRLKETCEILDFWAHYTLDKTFNGPTGWEVQNQLTVAKVVALSALERTESIGVHYRSDSDATASDVVVPYHVTVVRDTAGTVAKRTPI